MAEPSLEDIVSRCELAREKLQEECSREIVLKIALKLEDWKVVGHFLCIPPRNLKAIERENDTEDQRKIAMLDIWKKREGKAATYMKLFNALCQCGRKDLVESLCKAVNESVSSADESSTDSVSAKVSTDDRTALNSGEKVPKNCGSDLVQQIEKLETQFCGLYQKLVSEVIKKRLPVDEFYQALAMLPIAFRKEYESAVQQLLPPAKSGDDNSTSVVNSSVFLPFTPLFVFIDYDLLNHIISMFGSTQLKNEMSLYIENVQVFMRETTVGDLIDHWPGCEVSNLNYAKLKAKFKDDPMTYTLERLNKFRRRFCGQVRLSELLFCLISLESTESFLATWIIPTVVVPELTEAIQQLDESFYQEEHITSVFKDEEQLYPFTVTKNNAMTEQTGEGCPYPQISENAGMDPIGTGNGVQQPQASATGQLQLGVCPPAPLVFSEDLSYEQLAVWLTNHPKLVGVGYKQDISKLKDDRVNGNAFLRLDESMLRQLGVTLGFRVTLIDIIQFENLKRSQHCKESETLQLQQQSPTGSTAPPTTQPQSTFSTLNELDQLPTLNELTMLTYMTEKRERKKVQIIEEASHKWKDIASLICDNPNKVSKVEEKHRGNRDNCLRQTLVDDFIIKKPARYSHNWSGMIELLDNVNLEELAGRVKCALLLDGSSLTSGAIWKLPGVEEFDETSVVIFSSQGQRVDWNGLKLHIYEDSLPEGIDQCTIYIKASLAGEYEVPENSSLVSAIFWLRCEPQCTFIKPITVEIQHCSTKQDLSRLQIVRAFCSQKQLPYNFKPLVGCRFNSSTSYGAIEVNSFSGVGVVEKDPAQRLYYNQLFYRSCISQHRSEYEIYIIYTWNLKAHIKYVSKSYTEQQGFHASLNHQVIQVNEAVIRVDLEETWTRVMEGQWAICPIKSAVTKVELDDFRTGKKIPNCMLEAHSLSEDYPRLLHRITLSGVKPPYNKLTLRPPEMPSPRSFATVQRTGVGGTSRLSSNDFNDIYFKLKDHAAKWRDIGTALGFSEAEMDTIWSHPVLTVSAPDSWLKKMLTQWLQWAPGDGRGSVGFATRDSLHVALLRAGLGQLAQQF